MRLAARTRIAGLNVASQQGAYPVDLFDGFEQVRDVIATLADTFALVDEAVLRLYGSLFRQFDPARVLAISATEHEKSLAGVEKVATFLQRGAASRRSTLLVVGGGIVQDIGTFTAHIFYRGIPYVYLPTTLLSMSDSCIGAKCGINLGSYKNQIGFFQSPSQVAIVPDFLESLALSDIRSGFGEILKLAIIAGADDYAWIEQHLDSNGFALSGIEEAILRSLETKRAVIEVDEYERGIRKTLNYGHTFGHALESLTEHEVPHGLAVAWGVDVANFVAMTSGLLAPQTYARLHALIARHFALEVAHTYDAPRLLQAMKRDKKAAGGSVDLILPAALGRLTIVPTSIDAALEDTLARYLRNNDIFSKAA